MRNCKTRIVAQLPVYEIGISPKVKSAESAWNEKDEVNKSRNCVNCSKCKLSIK